MIKQSMLSFSSLLILLLASTAIAQNFSTVVSNDTAEVLDRRNKTILEKWEGMEASLKNLAGRLVKNIISTSLRSQESQVGLNVSTTCMSQVMKLLIGFKKIRPWAFSFIDASGKIIDGMLQGSLSNIGAYDQCLDTEALEEKRGKSTGKVLFTGQYCALDIRPPLPPKKFFYKVNDVPDVLRNFSQGNTVVSEAAKFAQTFYLIAMRIGICVPSGCSAADISQVTNKLAERSGLAVHVKRCEVRMEKVYTKGMIAIITFYSVLGLIMFIGTMLDIFSYYTKHVFKSIWLKVLMAFSFTTNFQKLVNTENVSGPFACFHGMRVLSITWIVLAHTYLNVNFQLFREMKSVLDYSKDFAFQSVLNASVAVDTFFLMGGTLVCYLTVKIVKETKRPFNIGLYIFHRLYRILPIYSLAICFMFLAPLTGDGPVWHDTVDPFVESCQKNWWTNFLFINNFYDGEHMCLPQSWYIACDVQLYIAALIILLPLLRWPKVGISIAVMGIFASIISSAAIIYAKGYPPTMLFVHPDHDQRMTQWSSSYFKPYSHAGPYCVGTLLGYLLALRPKLKFSLLVRMIGWPIAIATNMAVLYGVWSWNKGIEPTTLETLLYSGCHRVAWALGVAWVIANCATGQAGVVNYVLTWRIWVVLGRLTYGAYLLHPMVQIAAVGNLRMTLMPWHYFAVWVYFGHLFITYSCSFVATMLVEAPFLNLEKIMFRKKIEAVKTEMESKQNGLPVTNTSDQLDNPKNGHVENGFSKPVKVNGVNHSEEKSSDREFICRL